MTLKEQPLINAVSRTGPLWSPSNPWLAGVWGTLAVGVFGMLAMLFQAFGRGAVYPDQILAAVRLGLLMGFGLSGVGYLYLIGKALRGDGEFATLAPFITAGMLTMGVFVVLDFFFIEDLRAFLAHRDPVIPAR